MRKIIIFIMAYLIAVQITVAANNIVIRDMSDVVNTTNISIEKKQMLNSVINSTLSRASDLEGDKVEYAKQNIRIYLRNILATTGSCPDADFQAVVSIFEWNLRNYVALPVLSVKERQELTQVMEDIKNITNRVIDAIYSEETPQKRDEMRSFFQKEIRMRSEMVGNYFYPEMLYKSDKYSEDNIEKMLKNAVFKDHQSETGEIRHYKSVGSYSGIGGVIRGAFKQQSDLKSDAYKPVPHEYQKALNKVERETYKQFMKRQEETIRNRNLANEAGINDAIKKMTNDLKINKNVADAEKMPDTKPGKNVQEKTTTLVREKPKNDIARKVFYVCIAGIVLIVSVATIERKRIVAKRKKEAYKNAER